MTKTRALDEMLVDALCAGYRVRADALRTQSGSRRTLMEYAYLNGKILDAAMEITADEGESLSFIEEIGARRGYVNSALAYSESAYKEKKSEIRKNILKKLHLTDA